MLHFLTKHDRDTHILKSSSLYLHLLLNVIEPVPGSSLCLLGFLDKLLLLLCTTTKQDYVVTLS